MCGVEWAGSRREVGAPMMPSKGGESGSYMTHPLVYFFFFFFFLSQGYMSTIKYTTAAVFALPEETLSDISANPNAQRISR